LAVVAVACSGGGGDGATETDDDAERNAIPGSNVLGEPIDQVTQTPGSLEEGVESGLRAVLESRGNPEAFPEDMPASVDPAQIFPGGPPPDGIPAIENPKFAPASDIDFLEGDEPVLAIEVDGEVRAYPIQIMTLHEIVNDTIAGRGITVTFCPLCNSAVAYERQVGDRVLDFGTSGMLHNSALVMYDRQTESLWDHFTASAIVGELTGSKLEVIPLQTVGWETFRDNNPDALVLTRDTGFEAQMARYGQNPYSGYDDIDGGPNFPVAGSDDDRLRPMERIVTVSSDQLPKDLQAGAKPVAVVQEDLVKQGVLEVDMGGTTLTVWAEPGAASALETGTVRDGRDVGQTGVFVPNADGRQLTFERRGDAFVDKETGSRWNILGEATDGELAGTKLQSIPHLNTFWFAWAAFQPDTEIVDT
jgi:hypothetical protein